MLLTLVMNLIWNLPAATDQKVIKFELIVVYLCPVFSNRLIEIASTHSFSDRALRDVIKLFQEALPQANNVPSFHYVQKFSNSSSYEMRKKEFPNGVAFFFDIKHQLEHVLEQNFEISDNPYIGFRIAILSSVARLIQKLFISF